MPEMDGVQARYALQEQLSAEQLPKIVPLTANAMEADQDSYLKAGMTDCLVKLLKVEAFQHKIKEWFGANGT